MAASDAIAYTGSNGYFKNIFLKDSSRCLTFYESGDGEADNNLIYDS